MRDLKLGQAVLSKAGHDKGRWFAVVGLEQNFALIADGKSRKLGVFSLRGVPAEVKVELPDGEYRNLLDDSVVKVSGGVLNCTGDPILLAGLVR